MDWLDAIITAACTLIGALSGAGIIFYRENKKSKAAEASKNTTDARLAEADLAEKILEKYEKGILARMDTGDAVRKQEFKDLESRLGRRFDAIEAEDHKQNEILRDVIEYLNGGFQQFEKDKRRKTTKPAKKTAK